MNGDEFGLLAYVANIAQLLDLVLNLSQTSNDELMKHLRKQDNILSEQTNDYLKKILENQEKIMKMLEDMKCESDG